jgi:hypothetical protein
MAPKNPKTEKIKQRLEQIKAAAKSAEKEIEIASVPSDVEAEPVKSTVKAAAPVKAANVETVAEQFTLDGANKFIWLLDGQRLAGWYRINDTTIVVADPVVGYTSSVPTTLALAMSVQGIGKLVELEKADVSIPRSFKLRSGELIVSMATSISLPRIVWRTTNRRTVVWAIVQYRPLKNEWRIMRLRSAPMQTIYEAQQILRVILGGAYDRLREAIELLATPI